MEFRCGCGNAVLTSKQSWLAIELCYYHPRIVNKLAEKRRQRLRASSHWLHGTACICALALCFSSAAAQDNDVVSEKINQLDEMRRAGDIQHAVPNAEEVWQVLASQYETDRTEAER